MSNRGGSSPRRVSAPVDVGQQRLDAAAADGTPPLSSSPSSPPSTGVDQGQALVAAVRQADVAALRAAAERNPGGSPPRLGFLRRTSGADAQRAARVRVARVVVPETGQSLLALALEQLSAATDGAEVDNLEACVHYLLQMAPVLADQADGEGTYPLHQCAQAPFLSEEVLAAVLHAIHPSKIGRASKKGDTPLAVAVRCGNVVAAIEMIRALHEARRDPLVSRRIHHYLNSRDSAGEPLLVDAITRGLTAVAGALLQAGAVPAVCSKATHHTALHAACISGSDSLVNALLRHPDARDIVNLPDKHGNTPLLIACARGQLGWVQRMLQLSAWTAFREPHKGDSPLHVAVRQQNIAMVNALLPHCTDESLLIRNHSALTCLELAEHLQSPLELLEPLRHAFASTLNMWEHPAPLNTEPQLAIQVCSDLHVEFEPEDVLLESVTSTAALLGDIGVVKLPSYERCLARQAESFETVFVVAGNHESYGLAFEDCVLRIQNICSKYPSLKFMNRTSDVLGPFRILGCTLWANIEPQERTEIKRGMSDYRLIKTRAPVDEQGLAQYWSNPEQWVRQGPTRMLTPDDTVAMHNADVAWLREEIDLARQRGEKVIVLTHHSPWQQHGCADPEHYAGQVNSAFCTNLESLLGNPVVLWSFGHTHQPVDFIHPSGTRICSNPHGYPKQKLPYNNNFAIPLREHFPASLESFNFGVAEDPPPEKEDAAQAHLAATAAENRTGDDGDLTDELNEAETPASTAQDVSGLVVREEAPAEMDVPSSPSRQDSSSPEPASRDPTVATPPPTRQGETRLSDFALSPRLFSFDV